mgnify:CR=1 FL=1
MGTALTGSIAVKLLVYRELLGSPMGDPKQKDRAEQGVGEPRISDLLKDIPGITKKSVIQQLANLKASGDKGLT